MHIRKSEDVSRVSTSLNRLQQDLEDLNYHNKELGDYLDENDEHDNKHGVVSIDGTSSEMDLEEVEGQDWKPKTCAEFYTIKEFAKSFFHNLGSIRVEANNIEKSDELFNLYYAPEYMGIRFVGALHRNLPTLLSKVDLGDNYKKLPGTLSKEEYSSKFKKSVESATADLLSRAIREKSVTVKGASVNVPPLVLAKDDTCYNFLVGKYENNQLIFNEVIEKSISDEFIETLFPGGSDENLELKKEVKGCFEQALLEAIPKICLSIAKYNFLNEIYNLFSHYMRLNAMEILALGGDVINHIKISEEAHTNRPNIKEFSILNEGEVLEALYPESMALSLFREGFLGRLCHTIAEVGVNTKIHPMRDNAGPLDSSVSGKWSAHGEIACVSNELMFYDKVATALRAKFPAGQVWAFSIVKFGKSEDCKFYATSNQKSTDINSLKEYFASDKKSAVESAVESVQKFATLVENYKGYVTGLESCFKYFMKDPDNALELKEFGRGEVHAEISLVQKLHLDNALASDSAIGLCSPNIAIGVSKLSCAACDRMLESYNKEFFHGKLKYTGSHGKSFPDIIGQLRTYGWVLPASHTALEEDGLMSEFLGPKAYMCYALAPYQTQQKIATMIQTKSGGVHYYKDCWKTYKTDTKDMFNEQITPVQQQGGRDAAKVSRSGESADHSSSPQRQPKIVEYGYSREGGGAARWSPLSNDKESLNFDKDLEMDLDFHEYYFHPELGDV